MTLESRIVEAFEDDAGSDVEPLQRELVDASDRDFILDRLSRHSSPLVRAWTSNIARTLADNRYLPLLRRLARDRDSDVRNVALQDIGQGWPAELSTLLPAVRGELLGENAVQALWIIADARDQASRDAVDRLARDVKRLPYQRNLAGIVILMLDGDLDAVLGRITGHDHDSMHWLAQAAVKLNAEAAAATLADYLSSAPDSSCRHYLEAALRQALPHVTFSDAD